MNYKKILFPFSSYHEILRTRWWHRLFVVLFATSLIYGMFGVVQATLEGAEFRPRAYNSIVITTLGDYVEEQGSLESPEKAGAEFMEEYSDIGCLEDSGEISSVSQEVLEMSILCLPTKPSLECFLTMHEDCAWPRGDNLVAYKPNALFYILGLATSLIALYAYSLILQLIYFKGLIYIIYGKENNKPPSKTN